MTYNHEQANRLAAFRTACGEAATQPDHKAGKKNLDKIRGCLVGGAAGDALGYAVEFLPENALFFHYGPQGITEYRLNNGKARFSDDTQMTLFTANGLCTNPDKQNHTAYRQEIFRAYQAWLHTQYGAYPASKVHDRYWLMGEPELFAARAPGNTCVTAIRNNVPGSVETPINDSKGCGGVMRVAPIGLYFDEADFSPLAIDLLGADAAALTHGHEMGYIPAAMLVHIIQLVSRRDDITLKEAVLDSMEAMQALFPNAALLPEFLEHMEQAVMLAEGGLDDLAVIHALGPGWCGDDALAVAVYCALKYADDFDKAMIAAVNHGGDSDSTGAITGNILGAYLGLSRIPEKYTRDLELLDVLLKTADELYAGPAAAIEASSIS